MTVTDKKSMLADYRLYRVGALAAILGVVILLVRRTTELIHSMGGLTGVPGTVAALLGAGMPLLFLWFLLVALFLFKSSRRRSVHRPASEPHDTEGTRTQSEEDRVSI